MQEPPAKPVCSQTLRDLTGSPLKFIPYESSLPPATLPLVSSQETARMPRHQNEITQLRRRVTRGEVLTDEERAKLTAYYGRRTRQKQGVHLKGDREQRWKDLADRQGVSFSTWVQDRVELSLQGPGERERQLQQENQALRDENAGLRGSNGHFAVENSRLHSRNEALEGSLMEALDQALQLRDGA